MASVFLYPFYCTTNIPKTKYETGNFCKFFVLEKREVKDLSPQIQKTMLHRPSAMADIFLPALPKRLLSCRRRRLRFGKNTNTASAAASIPSIIPRTKDIKDIFTFRLLFSQKSFPYYNFTFIFPLFQEKTVLPVSIKGQTFHNIDKSPFGGI